MANSAPPIHKASSGESGEIHPGASQVRLGELLCREGLITSKQLQEALRIQKKGHGRLSRVLVGLGYIEEETLVNALARVLSFPALNLSDEKPTKETLAILPYRTARRFMAFPLQVTGGVLRVTMSDPTDPAVVAELQTVARRALSICVSTERDIIEAYRRHYRISEEEYQRLLGPEVESDPEEDKLSPLDDFGALVSEAAEGLEFQVPEEDAPAGVEQYSVADPPIIKLVNGILIKAVREGVSDIHIEPYERSLQVRYRLDGSLFRSMNLPLAIKNALVSRFKILASLDITERRVPQDGRIRMRVGRSQTVDFRISTLPTLFGESVVLRVLDQSSLNVDLTKLGFAPRTFEILKRCIYRPQGLLLVTGPTGSGKTVTLYSILNVLNRDDAKILTAEDPVEFSFKGLNQVNVNNEVGMSFAAALKAFLRQDPDIIMVGEIRDLETAEIALKAAMTGHLVFSTLHTNDCPATIGRLVDIGIPPFMLASSLTMVLSQRLCRRLCPVCKHESILPGQDLINAGFRDEEIETLVTYKPVGCPHCNGMGYKGRVGLFELMEITEEVARAINARVPEDLLRKIAVQAGMTSLREAGLQKVREGITSLDEVLRRTVAAEGQHSY